jgi:serine protease Do
VIALGNPYALGRDGSPSAALGIIANIDRNPGRQPAGAGAGAGPRAGPEVGVGVGVSERDEQTIHDLGGLLQLDIRQHLGTSGGALIDRDARLLGLTTAMAALDGYEKSAGFAIPCDAFTLRVIDELSQGWEVNYGLLGVQTSYLNPSQHSGLLRRIGRATAVQIDGVVSNSGAQDAGLKRGDIVLEIEGNDVFSPVDVTRIVGRQVPGREIEVTFWRPGPVAPAAGSVQAPATGNAGQLGAELKLRVQVGKGPVDDERGIVATAARYPRVRGLEVDFSTARRRYLSGFEYVRGVLVIGVAPGSAAETARIRPGDFISHVNGQPVRTPAEFIHQTARIVGELTLQIVDHRGPVRTVVLPQPQ